MSIHYDYHNRSNPLKREKQQPLHARIIPLGIIVTKEFIISIRKKIFATKWGNSAI
ncbi:hypothetical protein GGR06_000536 [Bacteroides reticulotermitis]|uniref:Uncharacterized protein n=2 Tax=Bacteroides reticulotermitis TaxID=1133319 RepID=W4UVJ9_9BACE|nr:hypothetical protein [Bacteroides reticulotermitis]MBB4042771.1 hypothetical protein [Bacteroides reticulotermitis]GAE85260.1 hypothetical protein JCM10512_3677 [Bacteroides reticulotermitis JCM 10512]HJD77358.1 hypothetical protein [Bacteroides reticulotermitis]